MYPPAVHTRLDQLSVLAGVVLGVALFAVLAHQQADFRPEDAGLGKNTTSMVDSFEGMVISAHSAQSDPLLESYRTLRAQGKRVALWLGASQLHAVNRVQPDDHLAVFHANESAEQRGSDLRYLQVSAPNANLNELLATYLQLRVEDLVPDVLVLALTYDDLREPEVRDSVVAALPSELNVEVERRGGLENLAIARAKMEEGAHRALNTVDAMEDTPQQRLESALTGFLEKHSVAYAHRGELASWVQITALRLAYSLRSQATRQRVPPIPAEQESWNMRALDTLLDLAKRDGVEVLVYKAPHRPGMQPFFHDRASYDSFFAQLSQQLARQDVAYVDLETIVPSDVWGETNDGNPDVFHFRGQGHQSLGSHVDATLSALGF
jgi:hypothetical protein